MCIHICIFVCVLCPYVLIYTFIKRFKRLSSRTLAITGFVEALKKKSLSALKRASVFKRLGLNCYHQGNLPPKPTISHNYQLVLLLINAINV